MQSQIITGDALHALRAFPKNSFQTCVTSPPFWATRDYGVAGQIGAEPDVNDYVANLVAVFREVRRVLRGDGTLWLNIGDCYTSGGRKWRAPDKRRNPGRTMSYRPPNPPGTKDKDLVGVPWLLALALRQDGWYLRQEVTWHKPNAQPESVRDRLVRAHEHVFLLTKTQKYHFDPEAMREPAADGGTRPGRSVWTVGTTRGRAQGHFAKMPPALVGRCLDAGSKPGLPVLDPFFGSGTVGEVCQARGLPFVGVELNPEYAGDARRRMGWTAGAVSPVVRVA
jgi:site-specific DNA-methyltransferase (adenine-specific)/site-specific DNA-methyltransferase (cytosine-N4-specific)